MSSAIARRDARPMRHGETLTAVRQSATDPRVIEGLMIPYGVISNPADLDGTGRVIARETHFPGSAAESVTFWMGRRDGARMPFRPRHGMRPVGSVEHLEDTPDGVAFRARILETPAGDEYLAEVAAGINGVSAEFVAVTPPTRTRDGVYVQRKTKLFALAGSDMPAYDGARIALRDLEASMNCPHCGATLELGVGHQCPQAPAATGPTPTERAAAGVAAGQAATSATPEPTAAERQAAEAATVAGIVPRSTIRITRQEAVYSPRSEHTFLGDHWAAFRGNSEARDRQLRHHSQLAEVADGLERDAAFRLFQPAPVAERAGDVLSSEIPGAYPNDYLPGLLTPRILKGRPMGSFFTRVPISDARPRIFPKVTTSTAVAVQSAEGAALSATDFATTAVTATPLMYGAYTDVARQVLDGADPSAMAMLMQDLFEAYAQASETVIKTAVEAGASAGVAITAATPYAGAVANVVNYYGTRFKTADAAFIPAAQFTTLLAQNDTTGRPLVPQLAPVNSDARVDVGDGISVPLLGAQGKLSYASTANVWTFSKPSDYVIFESAIAQFSYDQVVGPQAVRVGIWAYLVVGTRLGSLKVTAA